MLAGELIIVGSVLGGNVTAIPHAAGGMTNTEALGHVLYTDYVYYFQIAGLVLLVAMIGAIVLTLRARPGVRRQSIAQQNARTPETAMGMTDPKPGEGV